MADIGKMHKGTPIPHAARPPREEGAPTRAQQSAPAPRGEQHQKAPHAVTSRNPGRVH
jgi:hypothetical protein